MVRYIFNIFPVWIFAFLCPLSGYFIFPAVLRGNRVIVNGIIIENISVQDAQNDILQYRSGIAKLL